MIFAVLAFVSVLVIFMGVYMIGVVRPETQEQRKLKRRLRASTSESRAKALGVLKEVERLSSMEHMDSLLARFSKPIEPLRRLIDQSGVKKMTPATFLLASGCAALALFVATLLWTGYIPLAIVAGAIGAPIPYIWLRRKRTVRMLKFEEQFPEAVDLIARALRAGHALPSGLSMVADELPDPVGTEFRLLYDRQNFGMPLSDALKAFADRIPVLDAKFFVTAVLTQREAGGNLAEVLDNLGTVIRDRFKVKRQVRVISAHGRLTGWVLAGAPPTLAFAFFLISPNHMQTLIGDPLGVQMLIGAAILQIVGTLIIRKIVDIEY